MTRSLDQINVESTLKATLKNTIDAGGGGAAVASVALGLVFQPESGFTNGTGANQADRVWGDTDRTILSGANEDIDVFDFGAIDIGAGAGLDALGQALALAEICALHIKNKQTSAGDLLVGNNATTAAWNSIFNGSDTSQLLLRPGGQLLLIAPPDPSYDVADATNHLLRMTANGGDVTYSIYLLGRSS